MGLHTYSTKHANYSFVFGFCFNVSSKITNKKFILCNKKRRRRRSKKQINKINLDKNMQVVIKGKDVLCFREVYLISIDKIFKSSTYWGKNTMTQSEHQNRKDRRLK